MPNHSHPKTDELHVFFIPSDPELPMEMKVLPNHWADMARLIGGYITLVRGHWPRLNCGCELVILVDEEGLIKRLNPNSRLAELGPYFPEPLVGNAFLCIDSGSYFSSLPPEFHHWDGPGHSYPTPAQPWDAIDEGNKS